MLSGWGGWLRHADSCGGLAPRTLPGWIGRNYRLTSAPIALALGAMKKNLAADVATLSGGEASGFADRGTLEADLGALAKPYSEPVPAELSAHIEGAGDACAGGTGGGHPELVVAARSSYWAVELEGLDR